MSRFHNRNFELLEPYDAKVSCTVLRGKGVAIPLTYPTKPITTH